MADFIPCEVRCPDGTVIAEELSWGEAVDLCRELDMDEDAHRDCWEGHRRFAKVWVKV